MKPSQKKFISRSTPSPTKTPDVWRGHQYAEAVVSGKVVANKYIRGACERYLQDLDSPEADFYFDAKAAERYLRIVQRFEHVEGHWKTKKIIYEPWQCWVWMCIIGFKMKATGFRRFRVAHLEVARGNAKSTMASQVCLYFLALDNPNGNYISTVATKRDQARIVLDSARAMANKCESFLNATGVIVRAHTILHPDSNSIMRAQSSDQDSLDGLKDVLAVCDELHAMNRPVFEVITSGMSKRKDSLLFCITTAGSDTNSVGYFQTQYAKKVATGEVQADSFFSAVYTLDDDDDWTDESCWIKANPNLGVSVDLDDLRSKVAKAIEIPSDIPNIKIKHLNQWISEAHAFFDLKLWDKCADPTLSLEKFRNKYCYLGLDLASHIDITSIGYVFKEKDVYYIFDRSYLPEDTIEAKNNAFYENCVADGSLISTQGATIHYKHIEDQLREDAKTHRVQSCLFDSWSATELSQRASDVIDMVRFVMNTPNFSEPMKKLDALIREGKVRHNGSKLLRWCLGNVVAKEDANSNVFPRKSHEKLKIDPIIAIIMALAGWLSNEEPASVYETRGIRVL